MKNPEQVGTEEVVFSGRIVEVVQTPMQVGDRVIRFEKARRSPGVRMVFVRDGSILLTHEFRTELNGYDYRLPGGKVMDSLLEYREALERGDDMLERGIDAVRREAAEEVGMDVRHVTHIHTTSPGATVEWTLFYFLVEDFSELSDGQTVEHGEVIHPEWKTFAEVKAMCLDGSIQEERTATVLLRFLQDK